MHLIDHNAGNNLLKEGYSTLGGGEGPGFVPIQPLKNTVICPAMTKAFHSVLSVASSPIPKQ
jgi:hypothetical protein